MALGQTVELGPARALRLEGDDLAQPLHRIDGESAELAGRLARRRAQLVDPAAHQERAQSHSRQEGR